MTASTSTDGLWQKDERDILRKVRRALCSGFFQSDEQKANLAKRLHEWAEAASVEGRTRTLIDIANTLTKMEEVDLRRLEALDKMSRLDSGQATERTEGITYIIQESGNVPDPPDADANADAKPLPQAD